MGGGRVGWGSLGQNKGKSVFLARARKVRTPQSILSPRLLFLLPVNGGVMSLFEGSWGGSLAGSAAWGLPMGMGLGGVFLLPVGLGSWVMLAGKRHLHQQPGTVSINVPSPVTELTMGNG